MLQASEYFKAAVCPETKEELRWFPFNELSEKCMHAGLSW